ncbi:MAG: NAD-dependent epimerase/dehydratase family protein [Eubacteriales bacterium]|nr:NAD-dependent epimerase/dehydratase family protein [Eubacteriales bacterium]MDD3881063.1 NAD-dependent epimerase/dehydratase family protein [Eubacteriales bacterium]MDD4511868.1 NAD-dependent epimerase/dehydratase family protein [Eubacteriales bacterium]
MDRVYIVTGACGHLASTIIKYLRKKDGTIRGLILPTETAQSDEKVRYYTGDVTKPETLGALFENLGGREAVVFHAAGLISISEKASKALESVNVGGTRNIIEMCEKYKVKRLVYTSSVHAIPESEDGAAIEETAVFDMAAVRGDYAKTKAEATREVLMSGKRGLDVVVVHPSGIIGPYDSGGNHVVQMVKMYIAGKLPAGVRGGFDFVDVRDVALGCIAAAEKGRSGECYILSNRYCTIRELLGMMRRCTNGRRKLCLPLPLAKMFCPLFGWVAKVTKTRPLFTPYSLFTLESNSRFTHDKATMELGYHPRDMLRTVKDTIAWLSGKPVPI